VIEHRTKHYGREGWLPAPSSNWDDAAYFEYYVHPDPERTDPRILPGTTRLVRYVDRFESRERDFWYYSVEHYESMFVKVEL
jgi:hypothetical protein